MAVTGEALAYAKINLTLDVLGKREDGYHELRMVMQSVDLADVLQFTHEGAGLQVVTNLSFLPADDTNLAAAAARRFSEATGCKVEPLAIKIEKRIPVCAGMAGGSSDGAAVLRYLNGHFGTPLGEAELAEVGCRVGSDVPYCILGGTALAEGRGERLTRLPPLPRCTLLLCKPPFSVSTPVLFSQIDRQRVRMRPDTAGVLAALEGGDLSGVARRLYNVFEDVLPARQRRRVLEIKNAMVQAGALGAAMSGTGPTVYGIFPNDAAALDAYRQLKEDHPDTFLCHSI